MPAPQYTNLQAVTKQSVTESFSKSKSCSLTFPFFSRDVELKSAEVVEAVFAHVNRSSMGNAFSYCLKELLMNASKANTKRIYFKS